MMRGSLKKPRSSGSQPMQVGELIVYFRPQIVINGGR
jgi:hypothetical protein